MKQNKSSLPKLSVIVPAYNAEKTICRCIDSIINNSFKDFELLIINDGSTDNTKILIEQYVLSDSKIKAIHKEKNEGVGNARNDGLDSAKGKYIIFVDSDDYIDKNMFQKMIENIEKNNGDIVICGFSLVECDKEQTVILPLELNLNLNERTVELVKTYVMSDQDGPTNLVIYAMWNKIFKKNIFNGLRFEGRFLEDGRMLNQLYCQNYSVFYENSSLYYYCYNKYSLIRDRDLNKKIKELDFYGEFSKLFSANEIKLFAKKRYMDIFLFYYVQLKKANLQFDSKYLNMFDCFYDEIKKRKNMFQDSKFRIKCKLFRISPQIFSKVMLWRNWR